MGLILLALASGCEDTRRAQPRRQIDAEPAPYLVSARFRDAAGLSAGATVQLAGVPVGVVERREAAGRFARVVLRIDPEVSLWPDAALHKRASSLLGESYLELEPGSPASGPRLRDGDEITNVLESTSVDDVLLNMP